jgi:hypothetical protein
MCSPLSAMTPSARPTPRPPTVLSADGVGDEAKEVVLIALGASELGSGGDNAAHGGCE